MDTKRPTIGFLAAYLSEDYEMEVWRGLMKAALAKGIDLVTIDGGSLEVPEPSQLQKVSIYALAKRMHMDGLIVSAAAVGNFAEEGHMEEFLSTFPRVPQVMIGKTIGKHPAVVIDNHNGMRAVVSHLIEVHHRKRIAFVAGHKTNPEAMARFDGYREALETHGIPYDPELVYSGAFQRSEGTLAVEAMWAKDRPGLRPDALAASTDSVAMYAVRELQHRGIAVPDEVPVTGFDDIHSCLSIDPPLTTLRSPLWRSEMRRLIYSSAPSRETNPLNPWSSRPKCAFENRADACCPRPNRKMKSSMRRCAAGWKTRFPQPSHRVRRNR
jgi:DNA-binding LacI/PurR family transcriptional regulator